MTLRAECIPGGGARAVAENAAPVEIKTVDVAVAERRCQARDSALTAPQGGYDRGIRAGRFNGLLERESEHGMGGDLHERVDPFLQHGLARTEKVDGADHVVTPVAGVQGAIQQRSRDRRIHHQPRRLGVDIAQRVRQT